MEFKQTTNNSIDLVNGATNQLSHAQQLTTLFQTPPSSLLWSHGTNSLPLLRKALNEGVQMIEADISFSQNEAVMSHDLPQNNQFVNKFDDWFDELLNLRPRTAELLCCVQSNDTILSNTSNPIVGIKLDFKSLEAIEPTLNYIQKCQNRCSPKQPIAALLWLNADILSAPSLNGPMARIPAEKFLNLVKNYEIQCVLSLGWTTATPNVGGMDEEQLYTFEMVDKMIELCRKYNITQATFPLRTSFVLNSLRSWSVQKLLDANPNYSITLWTAKSDQEQKGYYDVEEQVLKRMPPKRTFVDLEL